MPNPLTEALPVRSIYIAVPAYTGQVSIQTAHSLLAAQSALHEAGITVKTDFMGGCCYLDHTRNLLVDRFLHSDATDLLFVDADVGFPIEAVLRMVKAERPVVAGIYPKKGDGDQDWPVAFSTEQIDSDSDGLIEACYVPTGFLRINRGVFDTFTANGIAPEYRYQGPKDERMIRRFFRCDVREGVYWGEDFQFCEDWRAFGGKTHIIPDIDFEHVGSKAWKGNWGTWFLAQNKEAA